MNCPRCGTELPSRPRLRMVTTGIFFIAAAAVLLMFLRLPIFVLAALLSGVVGASMVRGALRSTALRCRRCGNALT